MKLSIKRFRTGRPTGQDTPATGGPATGPATGRAKYMSEDLGVTEDGFGAAPFDTAQDPSASARQAQGTSDSLMPTDPDAIQNEGLTGRQLRLARRVAQRHSLPATSDHDAVRLLRLAGIDPFQRSQLLELVRPEGGTDTPVQESRALTAVPADRVRLPQTMRPAQLPGTEQRAEQSHLSELLQIQRDIARRRRRRSALLAARLFVFVLLPAFAAGLYYYTIATPLYATRAEFIIQQADNPLAGGMGGLLRGTSLATSQDSIAVQGYLQSREAMQRLDADMGFRAHFSQPDIDAIQRLDPAATEEAAYRVYKRNVKISYDPTEGIIKMEVRATDPATAQKFSEALISYAEEQVDHLTQRLRGDQMKGAQEAYDSAETKMMEARKRMVELQQNLKVISSEVEVTLIATQIGALETQLTTERLSLEQMRQNENPNEARMAPIVQRIKALEGEIANLRANMTEDSGDGMSLAQVQSDLLVAQADVQTRQMLLAQSLQSMETSRIEANRQVRYLSVSVKPVAPDEATYPRAFENTMVALMLFAGIYLMLAMTAEILREQVSS
jgi:capsular polysaccharide transport system permease protein